MACGTGTHSWDMRQVNFYVNDAILILTLTLTFTPLKDAYDRGNEIQLL